MAHEVKPVARHAVVEIASGRVVVEIEMFVPAKEAVGRQLELYPVESSAPRPRAATVANLTAVENLLLVRDEGAVEVTVRVPRVFEAVLRRIPIRNGGNVVLRDEESRRPQIARRRTVIDEIEGGLVGGGAGQRTGLSVLRAGQAVELHQLTAGTRGQLRGVNSVSSPGVAFEPIVAHHHVRPNPVAPFVVETMKDSNGLQWLAGKHTGRDPPRGGGSGHGPGGFHRDHR